MKIFAREISQYVRRIPAIPAYVGYLFKCIRLFRDPLQFVVAYIRCGPTPGGTVRLRNGMTIVLSEHPHDVLTVFGVFIREDYGRIAPGSIVVDIGANIGVFALYAVIAGAARVVAYEPGGRVFLRLLQNIEINGLGHVIVASRNAVVGQPGEAVRFPVDASMYNTILRGDEVTPAEMVETVGLRSIVASTGHVDLLKLDCEGAEYEILQSGDAQDFAGIRQVRLEYHQGRAQELNECLKGHGFVLVHSRADTHVSGMLWFEKLA